MTTTILGPGTLTLGTAPQDFSCEVMGGGITHAYETVGEVRQSLCGTVKPATEIRRDGARFTIENDLGASGLYAYLLANDLKVVAMSYTPSTSDEASWAGTIQAKLPPELGAGKFGEPLASEVTWAAQEHFTFTPAA